MVKKLAFFKNQFRSWRFDCMGISAGAFRNKKDAVPLYETASS